MTVRFKHSETRAVLGFGYGFWLRESAARLVGAVRQHARHDSKRDPRFWLVLLVLVPLAALYLPLLCLFLRQDARTDVAAGRGLRLYSARNARQLRARCDPTTGDDHG